MTSSFADPGTAIHRRADCHVDAYGNAGHAPPIAGATQVYALDGCGGGKWVGSEQQIVPEPHAGLHIDAST